MSAPRAAWRRAAQARTSGPGVTLLGLILAVVAVLSVSTSAVLIKLAGAISPFEIALWRLVIASTVLTPPMLATGSWTATRAVGPRRFAVYGAILAAHFVAYNGALRFAPIAHVLPLAYTSTVFSAVLSFAFLRERLRPRQIVGIVVVLAGVVVLSGFNPEVTPRILAGDALALVTALTFALYSLAGRRERQRIPLLGYAVGVYGFAAIWTAPLAIALASGRYSWQVVLALVGLGLIPNAVGHTLFNASLRHLNATVANVLFTLEVVFAILLGWLALGEDPAPNALVGGAIMLIGIIAVLL